MRAIIFIIVIFLTSSCLQNSTPPEGESLKKKFKYYKDDFEKHGHYDHLYFANGDANSFIDSSLLTVRVFDNGEYYLRTNYYGDTALNHHQIILSHNGTIIESSYVDNVKGKKHDKVCEAIYLQGGKDDFIAKLIGIQFATSKIRFVGEKYNKDITVSASNKKAIHDCMELVDLLKKEK